MSSNDLWKTDVFINSPIINQLKTSCDSFKDYRDWPSLEDYKKLFTQASMDITPVAQATKIDSFEEQYEPRVFLKRELQTRTRNWHDFFNAMVWLNFPETKNTLNKLHYLQSSKREAGSNRSLIENRITQFDECGAILISNNDSLLHMVQEHQWEQLFIESRNEFKDNFRCIVFGHAIFEKAINPYPGMTCHCILVNNDSLLNQCKANDYSQLDKYIARHWQEKVPFSTKKLHPYPVLGTPGYWDDQSSIFYSDKNYFR